jgi:hypothetical protein
MMHINLADSDSRDNGPHIRAQAAHGMTARIYGHSSAQTVPSAMDALKCEQNA